jgi:hypothetical protein
VGQEQSHQCLIALLRRRVQGTATALVLQAWIGPPRKEQGCDRALATAARQVERSALVIPRQIQEAGILRQEPLHHRLMAL